MLKDSILFAHSQMAIRKAGGGSGRVKICMVTMLYHVDVSDVETLHAQLRHIQAENSQLQAERHRLEQKQAWMRSVNAISTKSSIPRTILALREYDEKTHQKRVDGYFTIAGWELAARRGTTSTLTIWRHLECLAQAGLIDKQVDFNREAWKNATYVKLLPAFYQPETWDVSTWNTTAKRMKKPTTGRFSPHEEAENAQLPSTEPLPMLEADPVEPPVESFFINNTITIKKKESAASLDAEAVGPEVLPNCPDSDDDVHIVEDTSVDRVGARKLLLAVYGNSEAPCYYVMKSAEYDAKYLKGADTPIDSDIVEGHLAGAMTVSAYPPIGDWTRLYQSDTDDDETWAVYQQEARVLADHGFYPILEESGMPGRGGHVMLHFSAEVHGPTMMDELLRLAPTIASSDEQWPYFSSNAIRLPGGLYCHKQEPTWCVLRNGYGAIIARDGHGVCSALFLNQTPARVIPSPEREAVPQKVAELQETPRWTYKKRDRIEHTSSDAVVQWFNEHTSVDEILPRTRNGCAFAIWRGERTASVMLYPKTNSWCDFGANAWIPDGKRHDGGDAFELAVRVRCTDPSQIPLVKQQLRREVLIAMEVGHA